MLSLRTPEMTERYRQHLASRPTSAPCPLCVAPALKSFKHWKIAANNFPYDTIAREHHMIIPLRHVHESELTPEEEIEFFEIKAREIQPVYDHAIEAMDKNKSIPGHFHIHLIIEK